MRPSLPSFLALIAIVTLTLLSTGCVNLSRRASSNRVAVALTVNGNDQPNAEQWANVIAALTPELTAQGLVLVKNLAEADRILRIDFTPNLVAPNSAGHVVFLGWRINPLRTLTFAANPRMSLASVNYSSGLSAYHNSPYGYDRFADYNYSYGHGGGVPSPTNPTPPPPDIAAPPGRHRGDHPPGTPPPERHGPGRYVGVDPHPHPNPGNRHRPDHPPRAASSDGSSSYSSSTGSSSYSSSSSSSYSSSAGSSSVSGNSGSSGSTASGSSGTYESRTMDRLK